MVTINDFLVNKSSISYKIDGKQFSVKYPDTIFLTNESYVKDIVMSSLMPIVPFVKTINVPFQLNDDDKLFWQRIYKYWIVEYYSNTKLTRDIYIKINDGNILLDNDIVNSNKPIILNGFGKESMCSVGLFPEYNNVVINFQRREWPELRKKYNALENKGFLMNRVWTNFNTITSLIKHQTQNKMRSYTGIFPFLALPFESTEILQNSTISDNGNIRYENGKLCFGNSIFQTIPITRKLGIRHNTKIFSPFSSVYEYVPKLILHKRFPELEPIQSSCESKTVNIPYCKKCGKCLFNSLFSNSVGDEYKHMFNYDNYNIAINEKCENTDLMNIEFLLHKLRISKAPSRIQITKNHPILIDFIPKKYIKIMKQIYKEHNIKDTYEYNLPYNWDSDKMRIIEAWK